MNARARMNACARMIAGGWVAVPVVLSALSSPAAAQHPIPENQRWATITHAGSTPYQPPAFPPSVYPRPVGRVDYEYQIGRTEVTTAEWFEFVRAYATFVPESYQDGFTFTSIFIGRIEVSPGVHEYRMEERFANTGAEVGWRYAARYCNWLHNGKALTREAFESGAYDTSTFTSNPNGTFNDQHARSSGARYFLPSVDEWIKASYFDPNRHGPGMGGYWQFPNGSDVSPIAGPPESGETNRGTGFLVPVGSYPDTQSPWGLLDISGGADEWLETPVINQGVGAYGRMFRTSGWASGTAASDGIGRMQLSPPGGIAGFRLAREIPTSGAGIAALSLVFISFRRRRERRASCIRCDHV